MEDMKCMICNEEYNFGTNIPRLLPSCGHTLCSVCAYNFLEQPNQIVCPLDKVQFTIQHRQIGLENFPINFALMQLLQKKVQNEQQNQEQSSEKQEEITQCLVHQKQCDLICLTDFKFICAECVLFGEHKQHLFQKIAEFQNQAKIQAKALDKNIQKFLNKKSLISDRFLEDKKEKAKEQIDFQIQKIQNFVDQLSDRLHENLNEQFLFIEQKQKNILGKNQEVLFEVQNIRNQVQQVQKDLEQSQPNNKFILEKMYKSENICKKFEKIQNENKLLLEQIDSQIYQKCSQIQVFISSEAINKYIEQNCQIKFEINDQEILKKSQKSLGSKTADNPSDKNILKSTDSELILNEEEDEDDENELIDDLSVDEFFKNQKQQTEKKFYHQKRASNNFSKHASSKSFYLTQNQSNNMKSLKLPFNPNSNNNLKRNNYMNTSNISYRRVESNKNIDMYSDNISLPRKSFQKPMTTVSMKKQKTSNISNTILQSQNVIDLSNQNINDNDTDIIEQQIKDNKNCKKVDLSYNKLSIKGFKKIIKLIVKQKIENLDLCNNQIDNDILPFLEKIIKKKRLKLKINLMNNKIKLSSIKQKFLTKTFCNQGLIVCFQLIKIFHKIKICFIFYQHIFHIQLSFYLKTLNNNNLQIFFFLINHHDNSLQNLYMISEHLIFKKYYQLTKTFIIQFHFLFMLYFFLFFVIFELIYFQINRFQ